MSKKRFVFWLELVFWLEAGRDKRLRENDTKTKGLYFGLRLIKKRLKERNMPLGCEREEAA